MITIYDTFTYVKNLLIDDPEPTLLQTRYFPTNQKDIFLTKKVVLDFMKKDLKAGAFVKKGFINGNTTAFYAREVEPPRIGISDDICPEEEDRVAFEQLMYMPGADVRPTRADVFNELTRIKAKRLIDRAQRDIENMCVSILLNNGLSGTIPTSPKDPTPVDVSISFAPAEGNDQRFAPAVAWGQEGATPYYDVCAMVDALQGHGGNAVDLLISPEAWQLLREDPAFEARFKLPSNQYEGELFMKNIDGARWVAKGDFGGYDVNIISYSKKFEDDSGVLQPVLPKGFVCVLRPDIGRTLCGGFVKVDREQIPINGIEDSFIQRTGKFVLSKSFILDDNDEDERVTVRLESRPLPAPYAPWQWITMDAMNTNNISNGSQGIYSNLDLYGVEGSSYDSVDLPIENWVRNAAKGGKVVFDSSKAALSGYTFDHIEDDNGNTLTIGGDNKFTNPGNTNGINVIFKSVITFNNNTGSGSMTALGVEFGEVAVLPACTFTKSSNTFAGWALTAGGEVVYDDEDEFIPEGNITLYAVWEAE